MSRRNDIEYLKNLTFRITGDLFSEEASIQEYVENIVGYFTNIINSLPNNVYWLDKHCVLRGGNNNLAHQLNFQTGTDLSGLTYEEMARAAKLPTKELEPFRITELEVMKTGIPSIDKEEPPIKTPEKTFYYLSNKTPLRNKKGDIVGVVGISTDITKLKEAQLNLDLALKKAEAANQAKSEFLENMRHDIRTPVAGIVGCAQLIQAQVTNPTKITELANDLVESSDALSAFLNKVLESIKVASGEIPLLKKKFDLKKLLENSINLNKSYAVSKKLKLNLEYDPSIPKYVIGDPIRVQRIVLELVTNGLKFTEKGQIKITVRLRKNQAKAIIVQLSVSDTGMGIPADKQEDVYTRFTRLTPSYQGIYSGTGLGLSIVKQFMDDLSGEISLQSQPQQGSTFTCLIPFQEPLFMDCNDVEEIVTAESNVQKKRRVVNESRVKSASVSKSRVLVVEDNALAAKIAQHLLTALHYHVDVAESGRMALTLIEQHHYDLILMDIGLPDNDGGEVTRRIRLKQWKSNPSVPIVGLTAHMNAENKRRCIDAGMNAIYTKPLTPEKAAEIVSAFIPQQEKITVSMVSGHSKPVDHLKNLPVIDRDRALQFMGTIEFVKEGLALLVSGLTEDLKELQQRYENNDWEAIKAVTHKCRGGAAYCGARRLEEACQQLETYLQTDVLDHATFFYQQLIQEAETAREVAKTIIAEENS